MLRGTAREIESEAAEWAAKSDRGLTREEEAELGQWLGGDARRLGAYARMCAIGVRLDRARALGPNFNYLGFVKAGRLNRRTVVAGGAVAVSLIAITGLTWERISSKQQLATKKGEQKIIPLADGSIISLNTASNLVVNFTDHRRDIQLLQGEALFDVAKDMTRPFVVAAGDTQVQAVGTSFTVQKLPDGPVKVLVREGVVEVTRSSTPAGKPLRLGANSRMVASQGQSELIAVPIRTAEVHRELAWREGRIAFEGETLRDAATEFSRYSDTKIEIADQKLAREEIAGVFQANDPVGFAQAVAGILNGHAEISDGKVTISR